MILYCYYSVWQHGSHVQLLVLDLCVTSTAKTEGEKKGSGNFVIMQQVLKEKKKEKERKGDYT